MSEIFQICRNYNIRTGSVPPSSQKDIIAANDLAELLATLEVVEKADQKISQVGTFSHNAARTLKKNQTKVQNEIDREAATPTPIEQVLRVLNKTLEDIDATSGTSAGNKWDRNKFDTLRLHYSSIDKALKELGAKCSSDGKKLFDVVWSKASGPSQVDRLKAALEKAINLNLKKLSPKITDRSISGLHDFVRENCAKYPYIKKQVIVAAPPKKAPLPVKEKSWFRENVGLGGKVMVGYGDVVLGDKKSELNQMRGGVLNIGANGQIKLSTDTKLRLDYDSTMAYSFDGSDLVANDDFGRVSVTGKSWFAQAGFRHYRNDRPTFLYPNQNTFVGSGGKSFELIARTLSLDINGTYQAVGADSGLQHRLLGSAGVTYKAGKFYLSPSVFGGGIFAGDEKQAVAGGQIDTGLQFSGFGMDLKTYAISYPGVQHNIGWQIGANVPLGKRLKLLFTLGPGEIVIGKDKNAANIQEGAGVSFNWPNEPGGGSEAWQK